MKQLFCFGAGYVARRLATALAASGWRIAGTARSDGGVERLNKAGIEGWRFDGTSPLADGALADATQLLISIPPDGRGDPALRLHADDIASLPGLARIGYLSTTGVYGDRGGGWVDETTPPAPGMARAARRVEAEAAWRALGARAGVAVDIFRLAGIYGPGRSALDQVRAGTARRLVMPGQVFSRIHVDDIVRVLAAVLDKGGDGGVYNVCDDEPAPTADVIAFACGLLGIAPPPEIPIEQADLSPMAKSFYAENRRVRNDRIKTDLGVRLAFPDYRAGLRAIHATETLSADRERQ